MSKHNDAEFESCIRNVLKKTKWKEIPPLTPDRLASLCALIPVSASGVPGAVWVWNRLAGKAMDIFSLIGVFNGLTVVSVDAPLMRGDEEGATTAVSLPLPKGELRVRLEPRDNRAAVIVLHVDGELAARDDLSVELALNGKLTEARPLERKAEVRMGGPGEYILTVFKGVDAVGEMRMTIKELE